VLVLIWILSYGYRKDMQKDTTLYDTISNGIKDVRNNFKK